MPVQDLPNPLKELQDPIDRVLWHEIGQVLREHYGADVGIRQLLTQLIGPVASYARTETRVSGCAKGGDVETPRMSTSNLVVGRASAWEDATCLPT